MNCVGATAEEWAAQVFEGSQLPDVRLKRRLIRYAARQADAPAASTAKACGSDLAEREGAYRLLENPRVDASGIDEGPHQACAAACAGSRRLLAIQDTSSVRVHFSELAESLQDEGNPTGFLVHTTMMVCGETGLVLGIADQQRWVRTKTRPGKASRKQRDYEVKESARWQHALERTCERLWEGTTQLISVCDREADIYEFLSFHVEYGLDFVIRASSNRRTTDELGLLFDAVNDAPVICQRQIRIEQRGAQQARKGQAKRKGRSRRDVLTHVHAARVCLKPPAGKAGLLAPIEVNVVRVVELEPSDESTPLEWILLTSLPIDTEPQVEQVVEDYERRWLIEQFHKCWKTGCRLETRPLQTLEAMDRMMAITAPIAIRILQLQCASADDESPTTLADDEWRCLWVSTCDAPLPTEKPSARWAYLAVAKLGGFYDSKRTGRAGWQTLWEGWHTLQARLAGWRAALRMARR